MKKLCIIISALILSVMFASCGPDNGHETVTHQKATMTGDGEEMEMDYDDVPENGTTSVPDIGEE